jgi:hypothetical protein
MQLPGQWDFVDGATVIAQLPEEAVHLFNQSGERLSAN